MKMTHGKLLYSASAFILALQICLSSQAVAMEETELTKKLAARKKKTDQPSESIKKEVIKDTSKSQEKTPGPGTIAIRNHKEKKMKHVGGVDLTGAYPSVKKPDLSTLSGQIESLDADSKNGKGFAFAKFAQKKGCDGMLFGSEGSVLHHVSPDEVSAPHIQELHLQTQQLKREGQVFAYRDMFIQSPHLIEEYRKLPGWKEFFDMNSDLLEKK